MREPKEQDKRAAYDWGLSVGRVGRANGNPFNGPQLVKHTGLRGMLRSCWALGYVAGLGAPKDGR